MESQSDNLRDRLLSQYQPDAGKLAAYQKEVDHMLERHEKELGFEKGVIGLMWIFVVLGATAFFTLWGVFKGDAGVTIGWMSTAGTILFISGALAAQLVGHRIGSHHLEMLKELKNIEMRVLELQEAYRRLSSS